MKFTKEEINLCKQIAEILRKPIEYGDWYLLITTNPIDENDKEESLYLHIKTKVLDLRVEKDFVFHNEFIPLWQIQDALDWLEKRNCDIHLTFKRLSYRHKKIHPLQFQYAEGETSLEALLKAVLEVLWKEGEK